MENALAKINNDLSQRVLGQEKMAKAMTLALMCREHVAVIGPPGEGKTMMASMLANNYIEGWSSYYHLMTRYTTPDEVIGHFSVAKLQQDIYERKVSGKAPESEIVVLDEVFKANSPMLNSLLGMLNERRVDGIDCKLETLLGCSNEYPSAGYGDDAVNALWDRFLIRIEIKRASQSSLRNLLSGGGVSPMKIKPVKASEIHSIQDAVEKLSSNLPEHIIDAILQLQAELVSEGMSISTRRMLKATKVIAASAILRGKDKISHSDMQSLSMVLWDSPEDREILSKALLNISSPVVRLAKTISLKMEDMYDAINRSHGVDRTAARYEMIRWLKSIASEVKNVKASDDEDEFCIQELKQDIKDAHAEVMRSLANEEVEF